MPGRPAVLRSFLFRGRVLVALHSMGSSQEGSPVDRLGWLAGCWEGTLSNGATYEEAWLAPRGGMMIRHRPHDQDVRGRQTVQDSLEEVVLRVLERHRSLADGGRPDMRFGLAGRLVCWPGSRGNATGVPVGSTFLSPVSRVRGERAAPVAVPDAGQRVRRLDPAFFAPPPRWAAFRRGPAPSCC